MPDHRYAQFCPLARVAEVIGERWTLLVLRELLLGPKRFSDLREKLPGVSSSVLAERISRLEERGLAVRRELPAPAPATVYELTALGRGLRPAMLELTRWGIGLLGPRQEGDFHDPAWLRMGLVPLARKGPSPLRCFDLVVTDGDREADFRVVGGESGTRIEETPPEPDARADASLRVDSMTLMMLAMGAIEPADALRTGALRAEGNVDSVGDFPALFETTTP